MLRRLLISVATLCILGAARAEEGAGAARPPGVVIAASPDAETIFVASPSIATLPDRTLVVSHDWSGPGMKTTRTSVYASSDGGETWERLADLERLRWATLFEHRGALYLMGVARSFGDVVIRRSSDGGRTWTTPSDEKNGVLLTGRYHTAPVPVIVSNGRIWRAYEESESAKHRRRFSAFLLSAPEDADLLDAASWTSTNRVGFEPRWLNVSKHEWSEGNVVPALDGRDVLNILRLNTHPRIFDSWQLNKGGAGIPRLEAAAMIHADHEGRLATFSPKEGFLHLPGAQSKFTIRYDAQTKRYWAIVQKITLLEPQYLWARSPHHQRNVLSLMSSPDLRQWTEHYRMLRYGEGQPMSWKDRHGFQYADWQFDGDDLVVVSRTAWNARGYHDANYITFHRLKHFRTLTMEQSPPDLRAGKSK